MKPSVCVGFAVVTGPRLGRGLAMLLVGLLLWLGRPPEASAATMTPASFAARQVVQDTIVERIVFEVLDFEGEPLADAEVFVMELERTLRTNQNGHAFLENVPSGIYGFGVRRVGYLPSSLRVQLTPLTTMIALPLEKMTTRLTPVVTKGVRGGLSGVVSDTAYQPLADAQVTVTGRAERATTDAAGRFYMALPPGAHLIQVKRGAYASQTIGVTVSPDSGRQVAVWLKEATVENNPVEERQLFELGRRIVRMKSVNTQYHTRDGLQERGVTTLVELARQFAVGLISGMCQVDLFAQGVKFQVPLVSVDVNEVEFVEVSRPRNIPQVSPGKVTSINGMTPRPDPSKEYEPGGPPECGYVGISAYLRR